MLVLDNHEPLKKIGIDQDKIFVKLKGYDKNGMWVHHPGFQVSNLKDKNKENRSLNINTLGFHRFHILFPWCERL